METLFNVDLMVVLTMSTKGKQGAPPRDSRGPWGGQLGYRDDWRACEIMWYQIGVHKKRQNSESQDRLQPIYLVQLWVNSSNITSGKVLSICQLLIYAFCYRLFIWVHCTAFSILKKESFSAFIAIMQMGSNWIFTLDFHTGLDTLASNSHFLLLLFWLCVR